MWFWCLGKFDGKVHFFFRFFVISNLTKKTTANFYDSKKICAMQSCLRPLEINLKHPVITTVDFISWDNTGWYGNTTEQEFKTYTFYIYQPSTKNPKQTLNNNKKT